VTQRDGRDENSDYQERWGKGYGWIEQDGLNGRGLQRHILEKPTARGDWCSLKGEENPAKKAVQTRERVCEGEN